MRSDEPDNPNRGAFYYYDRPADEGHLIACPDYDVDGIAAKNVFRSEGWEAANKKVTQPFNEWYPREPRSLSTHGTAETETDKRKAPERPGPHMYARFLLPPVQAPPLPPQYQQFLDDGWVSDDEGHPEESRITPCTFAFLATSCRLADEHKDMKPAIPKVRGPVESALTLPAAPSTGSLSPLSPAVYQKWLYSSKTPRPSRIFTFPTARRAIRIIISKSWNLLTYSTS